MKALIFAVALTGFASAAVAAEPAKMTGSKAPVKLTEAQMDVVTAGAAPDQEGLINVNVSDINVAVPVAAAVQALTSNSNASAANSPIGQNTGVIRVPTPAGRR